MGCDLIHQFHIESLHVPKDDELLSIGQDLHLNQVQITLELMLYALQVLQFFIKFLYLAEELFFQVLLLCFQFYTLDLFDLILDG